jgi:hypothetical protein
MATSAESQGSVIRARGGEQGLELQVGEPEGG